MVTGDRKLGPNAKKLLSYIIAREAVPPEGGIGDGFRFFTTMIASESVLAKDWDTPEEDEAWADL